MKKMMIAVCAIALAAVAQAATVQWQMTATSMYKGQTAYLLTSIAESYTTVEDFIASTIDSGEVVKVGMSYKVSLKTTSDDSIKSDSNFYLAVIDGDVIHYLDTTSSMAGIVYAPPAQAPGQATIAFATVAGSSTTAKIGGQAIPEPTSALMLLVGLAGLALKRKVA